MNIVVNDHTVNLENLTQDEVLLLAASIGRLVKTEGAADPYQLFSALTTALTDDATPKLNELAETLQFSPSIR